MSDHRFTDRSTGQLARLSVTVSDDGEMILGFGVFPTSSMISVPTSVAVKLATEIIELAHRKVEE